MYVTRGLAHRSIILRFLLTAALLITVTPHSPPGLADDEGLLSRLQLDIAQVLEATLQRAPEATLAAAFHNEAQARQAQAQRRISGLPSWEFSLTEDGPLSNQGAREFESGLQFELWWPGERRDALHAASTMAQRSAVAEDWFRLLNAGRVRELLAALELADLELHSARRAEEEARQLLASLQQMWSAGQLAEQDLLLAETDALMMAREKLQAHGRLLALEQDYQLLTGLTLRPAAALRENHATATEISNQHPLLRLRLAELAMHEAAVASAEREALGSPSMQLGLRRERGDMHQAYIDSAAVSVSIPLRNRAIVAARSSAAITTRAEAELALALDRQALQQQMHSTQQTLNAVQQALLLSQRQSELSARQLDMAQTAFELGETDITALLLSIRNARSSDHEHQRLQLQARHLISTRNQILGVLP